MCGRYIIDDGSSTVDIIDLLDELKNRFGAESVRAGEIYPTNSAPVLSLSGDVVTPRPAIWGFPKWKGSGVIINSRSETALEKGMFRESLLTRRCVIPSTGFFEWSRSGGKKKDKYKFNISGDDVLYMAGMTNVFNTESGRKEVFVILTTGANESMSPIHDRMPVILTKNELPEWLSDDSFMRHVLGRSGPELISGLV